MTKNDINLLKNLCLITNRKLHYNLLKILKQKYNYKKIINTHQYIIAQGSMPVCLIAHLDTVFEETQRKKEIYFDSENNIMWSPQGLGTDDRAGVFAILKILDKGYRPHIIFTQDEELGCLGARALVHRFSKRPWKKLKYILELDRRGEKDCVFYNCANQEFEEYIESFGFETDLGSFSDISEIAPVWGVAAANLSVGYIDEHSYSERCNVEHLNNTITKVTNMLEKIKESPNFKYIEREGKPYNYFYNMNNQDLCILCGGPIEENAEYACVCKKCSDPWRS